MNLLNSNLIFSKFEECFCWYWLLEEEIDIDKSKVLICFDLYFIQHCDDFMLIDSFLILHCISKVKISYNFNECLMKVFTLNIYFKKLKIDHLINQDQYTLLSFWVLSHMSSSVLNFHNNTYCAYYIKLRWDKLSKHWIINIINKIMKIQENIYIFRLTDCCQQYSLSEITKIEWLKTRNDVRSDWQVWNVLSKRL